jgi:molybdopterin converting factor small subunit
MEPLQITFPVNTKNKLNIYIKKEDNILNLFENLKKNNEFILEFLNNKGMVDDGPILIIHNNRQINFNQLKDAIVKPGDRIIFIPPILGG